jgi:hypothetical protein
MHYGPNPVYNIQIYFEDDDRNAQIAKQGTGITTKQLQEAQTILEYPEIDPERGLLLGRQFTWFPINPSHEHYTAAINTRDGGFVESVRIEQIDGKWRFRIIVNDNPATHPAIINCRDSGFPGGIESDQLSPCFPTYTAFPEPSSTSFKLLPEDETNRVMFLAVLSYASLPVLGIYALFALWLMGVPLCSNSQPNAPLPATDFQPKERATITVLKNIAESLSLYVPNKALAATAFRLADDLMQFLQNQGATPPRPFNPIDNIARAMGYQMTRIPDDMIQQQYCLIFSDQMAHLIPQLRREGAQFQHDDNHYTSPPSFMIGNTVQSIAVELREAATKLVASSD